MNRDTFEFLKAYSKERDLDCGVYEDILERDPDTNEPTLIRYTLNMGSMTATAIAKGDEVADTIELLAFPFKHLN